MTTTKEPRRGDTPRRQRAIVALATLALMVTGVSLALAGGAGPEDHTLASLAIRSDRQVEAAPGGSPSQEPARASDSQTETAKPTDEAPSAVPNNDAAPQVPAQPTPKPETSAPARVDDTEDDEDDDREVVRPEVRDDDDEEADTDDSEGIADEEHTGDGEERDDD